MPDGARSTRTTLTRSGASSQPSVVSSIDSVASSKILASSSIVPSTGIASVGSSSEITVIRSNECGSAFSLRTKSVVATPSPNPSADKCSTDPPINPTASAVALSPQHTKRNRLSRRSCCRASPINTSGENCCSIGFICLHYIILI